jgi:hypothetical protein
MRKDMFEIIIERPRVKGGWRKPGRPPRDPESLPRCEPMGRRGDKQLNENLAPLVRFLTRRLGQPWDEVHSEIAATLSLRSAVQKHVLDHVRQMVLLHPLMLDGRPFYPAASSGRYQPLEGRWRFYVCPRTGRLNAAPPRPPRKPLVPTPRA